LPFTVAITSGLGARLQPAMIAGRVTASKSAVYESVWVENLPCTLCSPLEHFHFICFHFEILDGDFFVENPLGIFVSVMSRSENAVKLPLFKDKWRIRASVSDFD
jgi:hypothetical protein